jgi:hypothetical protein
MRCTVVATAFALVMASVLGGCASRRPPRSASDHETTVADYRGKLRQAAEDDRRSFRVRLFVRDPDRIHAEVAGPLGGPRLILDGGAGSLAVSVIPDRTAYVGASNREALRRTVGLEVDLREMVGALLRGERPQNADRFERDPVDRVGWPDRLLIVSGNVRLELRLRSIRALPEGTGVELGTGRPAPGLETRPLSELHGRNGAPLLAGDEP